MPYRLPQVCQRVLQKTPRLDVLVNAAGILRMGATDALSVDDWQQTFAVNVGGAFNLFSQTMAQFRRQQGGAIVNRSLRCGAYATYRYERLRRL
ncbi:2,3-dihydro-2,3-dihydroxybenzoate dehydrogenase [Salmonella enterica subsp. enterica]|nr:2,3-dihydro-2,3-dihydroxybenzoate dehydrogenase [Salmonella enterica subsp. enterica] [Salmonella enterica subsp. enterica serovar Menston]